MAKNLILGLIYARCAQIRAANLFLENLVSSVTRYRGQLSLQLYCAAICTISEKTNDPILRNKKTDRWTRVIS